MLGNGDCTVIKTPTGKTIVVDTGEQDNTIVEYLLDRRIKKIDYLLISHFDSDHCGKTIEILEKLKVKNIVISKQLVSSKEFENIMQKVKEKRVNIIQVQAGDILRIDKDIYFHILWPVYNEILAESSLNNYSIVARLQYNNFSILFTGDIEEETEQKISRKYSTEILKSTVLKVAHHGSKTSSSEELIKKIQSQIALIGVEKNNKFGHPNEKVIEILKKYGNTIYRTDLCGEITIEVKSNGTISIQTLINK